MRRIRDGFRESQNLSDQKLIEARVKFAEEILLVISRQVRKVFFIYFLPYFHFDFPISFIYVSTLLSI